MLFFDLYTIVYVSGEWYSTKNHKTYDLSVVGGHTYTVAIEMLLSGDTDEYVLISDIFMECRRTYVPTIGPTLDPTTDPTTAQPTATPTNTPTETSLGMFPLLDYKKNFELD